MDDRLAFKKTGSHTMGHSLFIFISFHYNFVSNQKKSPASVVTTYKWPPHHPPPKSHIRPFQSRCAPVKWWSCDNWMSASVKKIVHPTGNATAIIFFPNPRDTNPNPISWYSCRTVTRSPWWVLNCSFRITSRGFVNAAPATPAVADLIADLVSRSVSYVGDDSSAGGKTDVSIKSFTAIAVQYFGTVFNTPAVVPCHKPLIPWLAYICRILWKTLGRLYAGSCNVTVARTMGWFKTWTIVLITNGGATVADASE